MDEPIFTAQEIVDVLNGAAEEILQRHELGFAKDEEKKAWFGCIARIALDLGIDELYENTPAPRPVERIE